MTDTTPAGYHQADPWKNHPRWECDLCPFDALDEDAVVDHVAKIHLADLAPRTSMVLGPDGQHIQVPADSTEAVMATLTAIHTLDAGDLQGLDKTQLADLAERRGLTVKPKATAADLTAALLNDHPTPTPQEP